MFFSQVKTFLIMYRAHCQRILDTILRANFGEVSFSIKKKECSIVWGLVYICVLFVYLFIYLYLYLFLITAPLHWAKNVFKLRAGEFLPNNNFPFEILGTEFLSSLLARNAQSYAGSPQLQRSCRPNWSVWHHPIQSHQRSINSRNSSALTSKVRSFVNVQNK